MQKIGWLRPNLSCEGFGRTSWGGICPRSHVVVMDRCGHVHLHQVVPVLSEDARFFIGEKDGWSWTAPNGGWSRRLSWWALPAVLARRSGLRWSGRRATVAG